MAAPLGRRHHAIRHWSDILEFDQLSVIEISAVKNRQVGAGEPKFHELEPNCGLAEGAPAAEVGRLSPTNRLDRVKSAGIGVQ